MWSLAARREHIPPAPDWEMKTSSTANRLKKGSSDHESHLPLATHGPAKEHILPALDYTSPCSPTTKQVAFFWPRMAWERNTSSHSEHTEGRLKRSRRSLTFGHPRPGKGTHPSRSRLHKSLLTDDYASRFLGHQWPKARGPDDHRLLSVSLSSGFPLPKKKGGNTSFPRHSYCT